MKKKSVHQQIDDATMSGFVALMIIGFSIPILDAAWPLGLIMLSIGAGMMARYLVVFARIKRENGI
jgi:hypothetical protein